MGFWCSVDLKGFTEYQNISVFVTLKWTDCNAPYKLEWCLSKLPVDYILKCMKSGKLNPLNAELNPICHLLSLLGVHHFLHLSKIRVKSLTLRLLMSYIYIYRAPILDVSRSHTQRRTTVSRTPLDEWSARRRDFYLTTQLPAAAHLLRWWVRILPGAWIFVCCECRVLSGRGLCDELITRPEESYRMWCVVVCDLETSRIGAPYVYDISSLRVNDLTLILLMWRKWWALNNASK